MGEEPRQGCIEHLAAVLKENRELKSFREEASTVVNEVKNREVRSVAERLAAEAEQTADLIAETYGLKTKTPRKSMDQVAVRCLDTGATKDQQAEAYKEWLAFPADDREVFNKLAKANKLATQGGEKLDVKSKQFRYLLLANDLITEQPEIDLSALAEKQRAERGVQAWEEVTLLRLKTSKPTGKSLRGITNLWRCAVRTRERSRKIRRSFRSSRNCVRSWVTKARQPESRTVWQQILMLE